MTHIVTNAAGTCAPRTRRRSGGVVSALFSLLSLHRSRVDLASLDEHMLKDVGLTKDEAKKEAERPVWDVPGNWRL